MSLESYNNFFNSVAESAGAAAGAGAAGGAAGAAATGAGVGAVEGVVDNVVDLSWVGDENKNSDGYHYNEVKEEPKMTVDEVYGKSNQSRVENQGDYSVSSNEKSNVDTSTFGKQNDITVTPVSVTENKGIVNNSTIQSVEGLNFQQKDKASQDILDSRKKRDEAEAEDKSNQMRDKIKATVTNNEQSEDVNPFQIGESDAEKTQRVLQEKQKAAEDADKSFKEAEANANKLKEQYDKAQSLLYEVKEITSQDIANLSDLEALIEGRKSSLDVSPFTDKTSGIEYKLKSTLIDIAKRYDVDLGDLSNISIDDLKDSINIIHTNIYNQVIKAEEHVDNLQVKAAEAETALNKAKMEKRFADNLYAYEQKKAKKAGYTNTMTTESPTNASEEETVAPASVAETAITTAKDAINNSANASEEEKAAAIESLDVVNNSITKVQETASKLTENLDNVSDEDIDAYMTSLKELNKNYEDANDKVSFFKRTDFNKQYVIAIAKANDFDVTLADGSKMSFSEFSTKLATKSPRIAEAMYNAKADRLEQEGHPVLAKIERNKAKMVGNWFGSKFTFADDLVRNQFNQMAETNMRATYAAYNNVLNNPNATPEQKTEARSAIDQANSLMTASAALKASTGFWSGIGDGMGDGTYGTTDPTALNAYQKTLNTIDNFTKIALGLGVTPGANRAYQNMYYLAGDKVNNSLLFNKDFNSDGFALCQEYGNSATAGMIAGAGELSTGVALMFNPSTMGMGANLIGDSVVTFLDGLYGVAGDVNKSEDYTRAVLGYFEEAKDIAEKSINVDAGNEEVVNKIKSAISQIENFKLDAGEVNNFDNWLEGSGSNTADDGKFNQALTYEEWLKLIEADPTMQEYAKKLIAEKKNVKENNADTGVNS